MIERIYDADGFRRIRPSERSPGLVELRLPNGRTIACVGFGPRVERAIMKKANEPALKSAPTASGQEQGASGEVAK